MEIGEKKLPMSNPSDNLNNKIIKIITTYPQGSNIHWIPHDATVFFSIISFNFLIFFRHFPQFYGFV